MKPGTPPLQSPRFLDQVSERIQYLHYSLSTEKVYLHWVKIFIRWHGRDGRMKHPRDMGPREVEAFLTMLDQTLKIGNVSQPIGHISFRINHGLEACGLPLRLAHGLSWRGSEGAPLGADGQTARACLQSKQAPRVGGGKHNIHGEAADKSNARSA